MGSKQVSFYRVLFYILFFAFFLGVCLSAFQLLFQFTGLQMELTETAMYLVIALFSVLALRLLGRREPGNMGYPKSAPMPDIKKGISFLRIRTFPLIAPSMSLLSSAL
jgi:hypothetical protein